MVMPTKQYKDDEYCIINHNNSNTGLEYTFLLQHEKHQPGASGHKQRKTDGLLVVQHIPSAVLRTEQIDADVFCCWSRQVLVHITTLLRGNNTHDITDHTTRRESQCWMNVFRHKLQHIRSFTNRDRMPTLSIERPLRVPYISSMSTNQRWATSNRRTSHRTALSQLDLVVTACPMSTAAHSGVYHWTKSSHRSHGTQSIQGSRQMNAASYWTMLFLKAMHVLFDASSDTSFTYNPFESNKPKWTLSYWWSQYASRNRFTVAKLLIFMRLAAGIVANHRPRTVRKHARLAEWRHWHHW